MGFKCEPGWELFELSCYMIPEDHKNWELAENDCVQKGGHLASIHSKEENDFLLGLIGSGPIASPVSIIGGKVMTNLTLFWTDDVSGITFDYAGPGLRGQILDGYGTEDCIGLMHGGELADGTWIFDRCVNPHKYICKKALKGS